MFLFANIINLIHKKYMAKVTGPLQSFSASGSVAKALTFMSHLGRNVVRGYKVPANPQTATQGNQRLIFGAAGRGVSALVNPSDVYNDLKPIVPSGSTLPNELVKNIVEAYGDAATLMTAFNAHAKDTVFQSEATALGLYSVDVSYATGTTEVSGGACLYALASILSGFHTADPTLLNFAPFTTALVSWDTADIQDFVDVITTVS
jgi:hypothetical protein